MDIVQKDDRVVAPIVAPNSVPAPVSVGSVEAGPVAPVENPTQAAEVGSSYPDFKPPENLVPFVQPSIKINIPGQMATMPPVSDMGTAKVDIKGLERIADGDPNTAPPWIATETIRRVEREELPRAA